MSRAKPMGDHPRASSYLIGGETSHRHFTPRQYRRWRHKHNRANGDYFGHWGEGCKGNATPRRAEARAARLERRR